MDTTPQVEAPFESVNIYLVNREAMRQGPQEPPVYSSSCDYVRELIKRHNKAQPTHYDQIQSPEEWNGAFKVEVYQCSTPHTSSFAEALAKATPSLKKETLGSISTQFVCFLWGRDQASDFPLFALTTGQGYKLIKPIADPNFSTQVAARIIDPRRLTWTSHQPLKGGNDLKIASHAIQAPFTLQGHELYSITSVLKRFISEFVENSSFYQRLGTSSKEVRVEFSRTSLSILHSLTMPDYQKVLALFWEIVDGKETQSSEGKVEQSHPGFRYLENTCTVKKKDCRPLDTTLLERFWEEEGMSDWDLSFPNHLLYQRTSHFRLSLKDNSRSLSHRPSFKELIKECKALCKGEKKPFCTDFFSIKVYFGESPHPHPIRALLRGELQQEQEVYYLSEGAWWMMRGAYLPALHSDFYQLLVPKGALLPSGRIPALLKPWYAKKEWVMFWEKEARLECGITKPSDVTKPLTDLEKATFSFVGAKGRVRVRYLTRVVLENSPCKHLIKKNFAALSELLAEREYLKVEELRPLFGAKAASVLQLLKQERPIAEKSSGGSRHFHMVAPSGRVLYPYARRVEFSSSANILTDNESLESLEKQLVERWHNHTPVQYEEIRGWFTKPRKGAEETVWRNLVDRTVQPADKHVYWIVGPITPTLAKQAQIKDPLLTFFRNQHERYRQVVEEEGYNRLFLDQSQEGYLVCDQVFPSGREKVELFDILYYGVEGQLFLYHVKSGFNRKAEQACAQILTSAVSLFGNRKQITQDLYNAATSDDNMSPFRKQLRQILKTKLPGPGKPNERFIALFIKRQITFVYGVLDEHAVECLLSEEQDPARQFCESDFPEHPEHYKELKQSGFLNEDGQITRKYLTTPKTKFPTSCGGAVVYDQLNPTRFTSVMAKLAVVTLADSLNEMGFGFRICQIPRYPLPPAPKMLPDGIKGK